MPEIPFRTLRARAVSRVLLLGLLLSLALACGPAAEDPAASEASRGGTAAGEAASDDGAASGRIHAAYVLLGVSPTDGSTRPIARLITDPSTDCPPLEGASGPVATRPRDNPHGFGVQVCEAIVDFGESFRVAGWPSALPAAHRAPTHPVVFGDSGCKRDDCGPDPARPFGELAAAAAELGPDLVLHAGDYNYRGTGYYEFENQSVYDAGDITEGDPKLCQLQVPYVSENAEYSTDKDEWKYWKLDFFEPAADLLAAAPWIFTRGNHELCSRAGPGWFYFLDPSTNLDGTQLRCPPQGDEAPPPEAEGHILLPEPATVELDTLRVAVLDSANACDAHAPAYTTEIYTEQLTRLLASIPDAADDPSSGGPTTWLLTHRPTWAVDGSSSVAVTLETAFANALSNLDLEASPAGLTLMLAGHMHIFQSATFAAGSGRPPQLVVGNSGVKMYEPDPKGTYARTIDGLEAQGLAFAHHGFLDVSTFDPTTGAWTGQIVNPAKNEAYATCDSAAPTGSICVAVDPIGSVSASDS